MASLDRGCSVDTDAAQDMKPHSVSLESGHKVEYWRGKPSLVALPIDDETQLLDAETELGLCGETQLLEEDEEALTLFGETQLQGEDDGAEGVEVHSDTQIMNEHNRGTLACSHSEDGSQGTEVLHDGDDEGLSDDGTTTGAVEEIDISRGFGPKMTGQESTQMVNELSDDTDRGGSSAPSDAHANEEGLPGSRRKSFSAVRTTSLRTSGYAATRKLMPKSTEVDDGICKGKQTSHDKSDIFVGTENRPQDIDKNVATVDSVWASVLDSEARDLTSKTANNSSNRNKCTYDDEMRHTTGNRRVRKLFGDKENDREDELASKTNNSIGKADALQVSDIDFQDNFAPGLSYICSQEPGELSQANALDLVDKLVCADEIVAPQIASAGNDTKTILPPSTSVKAAQSLAKSAGRSPVRKETPFDWVDDNEVESGGDFFMKIKSSISTNDKQPKKPRSQPKTRCSLTGRNAVEDDKSKGTRSNTGGKDLKLCFSDSKLQSNKLSESSNRPAFLNKIHKKLFKEKSDTPLIKPRRQNEDNLDFHMDANGSNGIGPDTQLAVEAMGALASGLCVEDTGQIKSTSCASLRYSTRRSKLKPPEEAINVSNPENSLRRSKRMKTADTNVNGETFYPPLNDLNPTKGPDSVEKLLGSDISDKIVVKYTRKGNAKRKLTNYSSVGNTFIEKSDAQACKTRSDRKRVRASRSQLFLNQKILPTNTSSPVANQTRLATERKISEENACCLNSATEPEQNQRLDCTLIKNNAHTFDSKYTSPLNKAIDKGSPVCSGLDPRVLKTSLRSSVARELVKLQTSELTPPRMVQDARRKRDMSSIRILFSRHLDDDIMKHQKKILSRLGVPVATSISDATHFVTDKFVRTRNLLEAMAVGKPVVTPMWVESCGLASCFIDERNYILRDIKKEKEIAFSMPASLATACRKPLLQGKRVYITLAVKPDRETVSSLVKAAGGLPMERIARSLLNDAALLDDLLVISCEEDYAACTALLEKGVGVFSSELLLNGIVIQKLEFERHRLFLDYVRRTRSTTWLRSADSNQFQPVGNRR